MKKSIAIASLIAFQAQAQVWTTPAHSFIWEASATPELVEGYRMYIQSAAGTITTHEAGLALQLPLKNLGLVAGRYEAWVIAYNAAAESDRSNILPFVFADPNDQIGPPQMLKLITEDAHGQPTKP